MMEENRRRRIDQILATGMTREEMAEALQSAERSAHIWQTCTNAVRKDNAELRELVRDLYSQLLYAYDPKEIDEYRDRMCELEIEVGE